MIEQWVAPGGTDRSGYVSEMQLALGVNLRHICTTGEGSSSAWASAQMGWAAGGCVVQHRGGRDARGRREKGGSGVGPSENITDAAGACRSDGEQQNHTTLGGSGSVAGGIAGVESR